MKPDELPGDVMRDILDIEGLIRSPWADFRIWGPRVLAFFLFAAALFAACRFVKRRFFGGREREDPRARALRELKELGASAIFTRGAWREFSFALSEIVKRYLTGRFGLDVLDKTTEEILPMRAALAGVMGEGEWERFRRFLEEGDRIKFARFPGTPAQAAEDLAFALELVKNCERRFAKNGGEKRGG